jgi:hypothetical protein
MSTHVVDLQTNLPIIHEMILIWLSSSYVNLGSYKEMIKFRWRDYVTLNPRLKAFDDRF